MSKQTKWILGIMAGFFVVLVFYMDMWTKGATWYRGQRTKNSYCYMLDFTSMNTKDSHTLHIKGGQELVIEFLIEKGEADVTVGIKDKEPVYRTDMAVTTAFSVPIAEEGDYIIEVRGKRAKGYMHFTVKDVLAP